MCEVLGVSPSAYYEWEREQQSQHARRDSELFELIRALFAQFRGRYGAPRIHGELAKAGINVSRKRVARLMREAGIRAKGARKYRATTDSKHSLPVAPNLLEQQFTVEARNEVWVSDITYIWTRQGWMYLAVIIDLFSRRVVGWSLGDRMAADLVCGALDRAVAQRQPGPGLIFHSEPRQPVREPTVSPPLVTLPHGAEHESQGQLLGQRRGGKLLRDAEERARARLRLRIASDSA